MNISFSLTKRQFRDRTKTVTRRIGWEKLKPGTILQAIEQGQGLKPGQHVRPMGKIRVTAVRREPLSDLLKHWSYGRSEVIKEGFPDMTPEDFVDFFITTHRRTTKRTKVTRIEFEYL